MTISIDVLIIECMYQMTCQVWASTCKQNSWKSSPVRLLETLGIWFLKTRRHTEYLKLQDTCIISRHLWQYCNLHYLHLNKSMSFQYHTSVLARFKLIFKIMVDINNDELLCVIKEQFNCWCWLYIYQDQSRFKAR